MGIAGLRRRYFDANQRCEGLLWAKLKAMIWRAFIRLNLVKLNFVHRGAYNLLYNSMQFHREVQSRRPR